MQNDTPKAVAEMLAALGENPTAISDMPKSLQRPAVLRVAARRGLVRGLARAEDADKLPNGLLIFRVGGMGGWYDPAVAGHERTHLVLTAKGRALLDEAALAVTKRPKPKHKRKPREKRAEPTLPMARAYESHQAGLSYREIGNQYSVSHETARQWVKLVADYYGDNAKSKRVRRALPDV